VPARLFVAYILCIGSPLCCICKLYWVASLLHIYLVSGRRFVACVSSIGSPLCCIYTLYRVAALLHMYPLLGRLFVAYILCIGSPLCCICILYWVASWLRIYFVLGRHRVSCIQSRWSRRHFSYIPVYWVAAVFVWLFWCTSTGSVENSCAGQRQGYISRA